LLYGLKKGLKSLKEAPNFKPKSKLSKKVRQMPQNGTDVILLGMGYCRAREPIPLGKQFET